MVNKSKTTPPSTLASLLGDVYFYFLRIHVIEMHETSTLRLSLKLIVVTGSNLIHSGTAAVVVAIKVGHQSIYYCCCSTAAGGRLCVLGVSNETAFQSNPPGELHPRFVFEDPPLPWCSPWGLFFIRKTYPPSPGENTEDIAILKYYGNLAW